MTLNLCPQPALATMGMLGWPLCSVSLVPEHTHSRGGAGSGSGAGLPGAAVQDPVPLLSAFVWGFEREEIKNAKNKILGFFCLFSSSFFP